MSELSLVSIIEITFKTLLDSRVLMLIILELGIIILAHLFKRLLDKKVVNITSIFAGIVILSIYSYRYLDTFKIFIDNASTKIVEMLYFPTTLQIIGILFISIIILAITYYKKANKVVKVINTSLVISISFIFLCMIEYMNTYNIAFDEFSVFSNPVLMSLNEVITGLFISWIFGLIVIKIDSFIISKININELDSMELPKLKVDINEEYIELPKLKSNI